MSIPRHDNLFRSPQRRHRLFLEDLACFIEYDDVEVPFPSVEKLTDGKWARDPTWRNPREDVGRPGEEITERNMSRLFPGLRSN